MTYSGYVFYSNIFVVGSWIEITKKKSGELSGYCKLYTKSQEIEDSNNFSTVLINLKNDVLERQPIAISTSYWFMYVFNQHHTFPPFYSRFKCVLVPLLLGTTKLKYLDHIIEPYYQNPNLFGTEVL